MQSLNCMDINLKRNFENTIKSKTEKEFESFIKELHFERYGVNGFISTRETKDKGSDGIISETYTVIASYGPKKYTKASFYKKADEDFGKYLKYWASQYFNWEMYYNGDISPDQIFKKDELEKLAISRGFTNINILLRGVDHIVKIIEEDLKNIQIRKLAAQLLIPKELFIQDYIREILDDLLRGLNIQLESVEYDLKVDIEEKINLNFSLDDVEGAKNEYELLATSGTLRNIQNAIAIYEDEEINKLKLKIIRDFNEFGGTFKQKIANLTRKYAEKYASGNDDDFDHYIRAILIYCFEQCIIGVKTKLEQKK